jgi:hypothetical protein
MNMDLMHLNIMPILTFFGMDYGVMTKIQRKNFLKDNDAQKISVELHFFQ